jgi:hypothetical protein
MSTRAQIAIQTGPDEWAHVYVHFDGYPAHMLPALERWKPEDILASREIRQVTVSRWIVSTRRAIRATCHARRGSSPIFTCGTAASG